MQKKCLERFGAVRIQIYTNSDLYCRGYKVNQPNKSTQVVMRQLSD